MSGKSRSQKMFRLGRRSMTEADARKSYPSVELMRRANERMTVQEVELILYRNAEAIRHIAELHRSVALRNYVGRVNKKNLVENANLLHDWRLSSGYETARLGCPQLWEE